MVPCPASSVRGSAGKAGADPSVAAMVEGIVGCKWSVSLLEVLARGPTRPSALLRACPGLSQKVMHQRLRKLTRFGILARKVFGEKPPVEVEYSLTPFGRRFLRILEEVRRVQEEWDAGALPAPDGPFDQERKNSRKATRGMQRPPTRL